MTWPELPLKALAREPITNGLGLPGEHNDPEWPRYIRTTDIANSTSLRTDVFVSQPPEVAARARVARGDILMTAAGATIGKSVLITEQIDACYAGFLVKFSANSDADSRFISYWTQSSPYWAQIEQGAVRSTIDNFSAGRYRELRLQVPPLEEQRRIADFLDDQVGRIDQAIEWKKAELAVLQEFNSAQCESFMHAVGERVPLKYLTSKIGSGKTPRGGADVYVSSGVIFLRSQNVRDSELDLRDVVYIDSVADEEMAHTRVRGGDVLLNITGGSLGRVTVAPKDLGAANVSQHVCIIRPKDSHLSELIAASLRTPAVRSQIDTLQVGGNREGLNFEQVGNLIVCVPSENVSLALESLANLQKSFEQVSTELSASISLCEERKRSLITAAVTGQLEINSARPLTGPWVSTNLGSAIEQSAMATGVAL